MQFRDISEAPEYVRAASKRISARFDTDPEIADTSFTVHDFLKENYWFTHKKKQYSIPYPKVKDFYLMAKLAETEDFKNNLLALYLLYYDDNRIYEGYDIPIWRLWVWIRRVKKWKVKIKYLTELIDNVASLMSFSVKSSPSDYTQYFSDKDMIIAVADKLNMRPLDILNMRVPAYAATLHNLDTISFVEECMSEGGNKNNGRNDGADLDSFLAGGVPAS